MTTALPGWRLLLTAGCVAAAAVLYSRLMPWHSIDADHWFVPWLQDIIAHGGMHALAQPMQIRTDGADGFANYNPPYLYLLILGSLCSGLLDDLSIVKLVAIAGSAACAMALFTLLREFIGRSRALLASAGFLLIPTVVLNSAGWGQADAIYTAFMLIVVKASLREAWAVMMLAFGAAIAVKLPAAFLGPFVLYVVLSRRVPLWTFVLPLAAYVVFLIPAWFAGRSVDDLATVYLDQAGTYWWLSMNVPNPWAFIQHLHLLGYEQGVIIGLAAATVAGIGIAGSGLVVRLGGKDLLLLATVTATAMPYVLPKMHDRYFYPAGALSYAFAVADGRRSSVAAMVAIEAGSLGAYSSILFGFHLGTFLGAVSMGSGLVILLTCLLSKQNEARDRQAWGMMPPMPVRLDRSQK